MPAAAVLARRASRKVKPMRDEPGSDSDADESEEWEDDDEAYSEEDESDEERCAFERPAWPRAASWCQPVIKRPGGRRRPPQEFGREGLRHAGRLWCVVWSRVVQLTSSLRGSAWARGVCRGVRLGEDGSAE